MNYEQFNVKLEGAQISLTIGSSYNKMDPGTSSKVINEL